MEMQSPKHSGSHWRGGIEFQRHPQAAFLIRRGIFTSRFFVPFPNSGLDFHPNNFAYWKEFPRTNQTRETRAKS
jgi:hypothetical protein